MLGCFESLSLIVGLVILIRGKFNLFSKRKLEGKYARIVGFILMLPGPVSLLTAYVFSSIIYVTTGDSELVTWMINERWPLLFFIDLPIFIGALVAVILVAWKTPEAVVTTPSLPTVLTIAETASYLQMPEAEILQLIEQGHLAARRIGDEYCLNQEVLTKFVKKCGPISLREMIGSMNPRVRNVMIGIIMGVIVGPTICGGLFVGGPYFKHGMGIGLTFGPVIGVIIAFLIARSGEEKMTPTTGRMISLILIALGVGTIVGVITFTPIIGAIVGLIAAVIFGWLSNSPTTYEPRKPLTQKKCPQCGASNRKAARRCMVCGATFYADKQAVYRAAFKALKPFDELLTLEAFAQTISGHDEIVRQKTAELLGERDDERVLEPLFHLLKDEAEKVRAAAAKSLGQLSYAQAMVPLLQTLDDPAVVVRRTAIDALQQWSDRKMVEPLTHALTDEDATVRLKAAQFLGKLKDGHAIEPLFKLLEDAKADVRQAALASLVQLGGGGLHPLTQALSDLINGDVESRVKAVVVLGELGDARAVGALQRALKSEKEDRVRMAVMQSLRTLGVNPIPVLIRQLEGQRSKNTAEALIQIGKDAVEPLLQALESTKSSTARWQIIQTLGKIGDIQAVPAIIKALGSNGYAKAKAAEALGVLGDPRATLPLVELLGETSIHPTREAVIQALIQLNDKQAIEPLAGLLESPKREYAIQVLQGMGEAGMQALIQAYENTKDRATRKAIGEALGDRQPKRGLFG